MVDEFVGWWGGSTTALPELPPPLGRYVLLLLAVIRLFYRDETHTDRECRSSGAVRSAALAALCLQPQTADWREARPRRREQSRQAGVLGSRRPTRRDAEAANRQFTPALAPQSASGYFALLVSEWETRGPQGLVYCGHLCV